MDDVIIDDIIDNIVDKNDDIEKEKEKQKEKDILIDNIKRNYFNYIFNYFNSGKFKYDKNEEYIDLYFTRKDACFLVKLLPICEIELFQNDLIKTLPDEIIKILNVSQLGNLYFRFYFNHSINDIEEYKNDSNNENKLFIYRYEVYKNETRIYDFSF
jgi:hypothetical protein